jgi:hypothetical protein
MQKPHDSKEDPRSQGFVELPQTPVAPCRLVRSSDAAGNVSENPLLMSDVL